MNEAKIKEVFSDEAFVKTLLEMDNAEDVQKAVSEKGIDLSLEEINTIQSTLASGEELNEDQLENVAGGFAVSAICALIGAITGAVVGVGNGVDRWTSRRW